MLELEVSRGGKPSVSVSYMLQTVKKKMCSCSSSAKAVEIMVVKVVTDHSTVIKFTGC